MNTYFKAAIAPAIALAAMLPLTKVAHAGTNADPIVVTSTAELKQWQKSTTNSLNRNLITVERQRRQSGDEGIVQVRFALSDDGRPTDVTLYSSTADMAAERIAMNAVKRLGDLSDVPVSRPNDVQFLANIIFADSIEEHEELSETLEKSERARLAAGSGESDLIVLGG